VVYVRQLHSGSRRVFTKKIAKCICIHRAVCDTLIAETFNFFQEPPDDIGVQAVVAYTDAFQKIAKCLCVRPIFMFASKVHDVHSDPLPRSDRRGF